MKLKVNVKSPFRENWDSKNSFLVASAGRVLWWTAILHRRSNPKGEILVLGATHSKSDPVVESSLFQFMYCLHTFWILYYISPPSVSHIFIYIFPSLLTLTFEHDTKRATRSILFIVHWLRYKHIPVIGHDSLFTLCTYTLKKNLSQRQWPRRQHQC